MRRLRRGREDRPAEPRKRDVSGGSRSGPARFNPKRLFEHHQAVASDSLHRMLLDPVATAMTWAVIGVALALPLCLALLVLNLQQLAPGLDQVAQITLYLETEQAGDNLRDELADRVDIRDVEYIGPEAALAEFESESGFGEALDGLDENPLPPVLVITPVSLEDQALRTLLDDLASRAGVASASLDLEWVQRLNSILDLIQRLTLGLAILLCAGVLLVIGNTVRLAIENRRAEIVVVKLVGGTDAWVARPFLYTGFWYGAGGGLLACLVAWLGLWLMSGPASRLAGLYEESFRLQGLGPSTLLLVLLGGGLLGWLGAQIAVLRHLRAIEPT